MKAVIYLDVLLLTNFALTVLFLLAAGLLAGVECRAGRLILGGALGGAASLALLAPEAPDAAALLYKVSTAALIVLAAYGWPGTRCFLRLTGWFCTGNLLLTGALLLPGAQTNNGCVYLPLSPGALLAGAAGVYLAVQGVLRFLGRGGGQVFPARLTVGGTTLDVRAFCDTGFTAQEPLSGRAVVLVRFAAVEHRLPPPLRLYLSQHFAGLSPLPAPELRVRFVPCTTVAGPCTLPAVPAELAISTARLGSHTRGNNGDRCQRQTEGTVVGAAASKARVQHFARSDCWEPQPGAGEHSEPERFSPVYAAFADLPPPPDGWEVLVGSETASKWT